MVFVSTPDAGTAEKIARALVEEKSAACVSVVPSIESFYEWEGKLEQSRESLLLIKTTDEQFAGVESRVTSLHPYEVPEIVAVPLTRGSHPYLSWIDKTVRKG